MRRSAATMASRCGKRAATSSSICHAVDSRYGLGPTVGSMGLMLTSLRRSSAQLPSISFYRVWPGGRPEVRMRRRLSLLLTVALLGLAASAMAQSPGPQVSGFSPQGSVKQVRQARAQFSAPMVPLGDPRLTDPFDVACAEAGFGRWVDTAIWVFDFARDLPAGLRCTFTLRAGLQSLDGRLLDGPHVFTFSTGGPAIRASQPREGSNAIDEEQAFVLELDAPAEP